VSTSKALYLTVTVYLLISVYGDSRCTFVFPCKNIKSSTVTQCFSLLFCLLGFPNCVHSDRDAAFVSRETRSFLTTWGIYPTSTPTIHREIASVNVLNKLFDGLLSCCCIVNVFPKNTVKLFYQMLLCLWGSVGHKDLHRSFYASYYIRCTISSTSTAGIFQEAKRTVLSSPTPAKTPKSSMQHIQKSSVYFASWGKVMPGLFCL